MKYSTDDKVDTPSVGGKRLHFKIRFLKALRESGRLGELGGAALRLLFAYLDYANAEGIAWPGNGKLAADCGMGERMVRQARADLRDAGMLQVLEVGDGRHNSTKIQLVISTETRRTVRHVSTAETRRESDTKPGTPAPETRHSARQKPGGLSATEQVKEQMKEHHHQQGGVAAAGGGGFSSKEEQETGEKTGEALKYLAEIGVNTNPKIRAAVKNFKFTPGELKTMWGRIVSTRQPPKRLGAMAQAVMLGDKSQASPPKRKNDCAQPTPALTLTEEEMTNAIGEKFEFKGMSDADWKDFQESTARALHNETSRAVRVMMEAQAAAGRTTTAEELVELISPKDGSNASDWTDIKKNPELPELIEKARMAWIEAKKKQDDADKVRIACALRRKRGGEWKAMFEAMDISELNKLKKKLLAETVNYHFRHAHTLSDPATNTELRMSMLAAFSEQQLEIEMGAGK